MMDLAWYILGVSSGAVIYWAYRISLSHAPGRFRIVSLLTGAGLVLFSFVWAAGSILEGVPRAASMGLLCFGLPGIIIVSLVLNRILLHTRDSR